MIDMAAIIGSKKAAIALWPLMIGMTANKAGTMSIDILKNWGVVMAAIVAAIYMGRVFEKVEHYQHQANQDHKQIQLNMDAAFRERDFKLNYVYSQATKGNRYTFQMAQDDKKELEKSINENSSEDNSRYDTLHNRMTRLFEKLDALNESADHN